MNEPIRINSIPHEVHALMQSAHRYAATLHAHGSRTAILSHRIAAELSLPATESEVLVTAAYVHDLGKLFVPASVLLKPAALSGDEIARVQRHARIGASCLSAFPWLQRIASIVEQHHERLDGTGYPDGRRAQEIDPLAKVLSVADAYVAMVEDRPYRPTLRAPEACAELLRGVGSQFDAVAVEALLSVNRDPGSLDPVYVSFSAAVAA